MKILILTNSLWNITNFRSELLTNLNNQNNEIYAFTPIENQTFTKVTYLKKIIDVKLKNKTTFYDFIYIIKLFYLILRLKPSLILSYNIKPNIYICLLNYLFNINIITNVTGLGSSFISKNYKRKLIIRLYYLAFKKATHVFFQNTHDRNLFIKLKIVKMNNSSCLPGSGINLSKFKYNLKLQGSYRFTYIGRLIKDKGIAELIEAIKKIRIINHKIQFRIIGNFDENNPNNFDKKLFYKFITDNEVEYSPFTKDVYKVLKESDAVILPSYREGTPRVLLEAMAVGTIVLASNTIGCNHLIKHNVNGLLFRVKNSGDLVEKILEMSSKSNSEKKSMIIKARELVENNYDVEIVVNKYNQEIYKIFKL